MFDRYWAHSLTLRRTHHVHHSCADHGRRGRDFHNFNTLFRDNAGCEVVAFTATQIPNIDGRRYPLSWPGKLYPQGIPIYPESELASLIQDLKVDQVVFAYSDVNNQYVMTQAAIGDRRRRRLPSDRPQGHHGALHQAGRRGVRGAHGQRQVADHTLRGERAPADGQEGRRHPPPDALRRPGGTARAAVRLLRRSRRAPMHHRGAGRVRAAHRPRGRRLCGRRLRGDPAPGRTGSGRDPVGRRQQRPAVLQARPAHRRGRSAPSRPRTDLLSRHGQLPHGRRHRDQQGGHRRPGRRQRGARQCRGGKSRRSTDRGRIADLRRPTRPPSAASACW